MERIQVSKYFFLDELVDPFTYFNESDHGLSKLDKKLFGIADFFREKYGPLVINNWWYVYLARTAHGEKLNDIITYITKEKTIRDWSGLRTEKCTEGSPTSAHRLDKDKLCKAIDFKSDPKKMYKIFKENIKELHTLGLRRIEDISITPNWFHIDTLAKNVGKNEIRIITKTSGTNIQI